MLHIRRRWLILSSLLALLTHLIWRTAPHGSLRRGVADSGCHIGIACLLSAPLLDHELQHRKLLAITVAGAVMLDLDHIPAAGTMQFADWSTMPHRPATHSALVPLAAGFAIEQLRPGQYAGLAMFSALASHLVRDLTTGGIPLFHPRRIVEIPVALALLLFSVIGVLNYLPGMRARQRESRGQLPTAIASADH